MFFMDNIKYSIKTLLDIDDGKKYKISLELPMDLGWYEDVTIVIEKFQNIINVPLKFCKVENNFAVFEGVVDLKTSAFYHYYFRCKVNGETKFINNKNNIDSKMITPEEKFKMSVNFDVPDWAKGAVMYHIFVDRFKKGRSEELIKMPRRTIHGSWDEEMIIGPDSNGIWNADFYGGDILGIEKSLDYIKSLGVSILYLSPVVWSQSNHRYDTSDYLEVDPYAGCNEDLRKLCDAAHKKGMKVVLDAVFNHTGNDSKYFNEYNTFPNIGAFQSMDSEYSKFYRKFYDHGKIKYDYWWGMTNLPVCDGSSLEWKNFITGEGGVIDHWFNFRN